MKQLSFTATAKHTANTQKKNNKKETLTHTHRIA